MSISLVILTFQKKLKIFVMSCFQGVNSKILKESPAQSSELALLISSGITDRSR